MDIRIINSANCNNNKRTLLFPVKKHGHVELQKKAKSTIIVRYEKVSSCNSKL